MRHVRRESAQAYPDVLRRRASSDLTTNSITCLSLIGEGFSHEREWLPAGVPTGAPMSACDCARGRVELMSGSVSRVTHGVTRAAVEVLRERERCFWGKLQTGWDFWGLHSELSRGLPTEARFPREMV